MHAAKSPFVELPLHSGIQRGGGGRGATCCGRHRGSGDTLSCLSGPGADMIMQGTLAFWVCWLGGVAAPGPGSESLGYLISAASRTHMLPEIVPLQLACASTEQTAREVLQDIKG